LMVITTPTPAATVAPATIGAAEPLALASSVADGRTGQVSSRGPRPVVPTVPETSAELEALQQGISSRVETLNALLAKIDQKAADIGASQRQSQEQLDAALALLNASPHRCPVNVPFALTSLFGYRTELGVREFHEGIDIGVWPGTEVIATQDGVVTVSGWDDRYGYMIKIQHPMGYQTFYAHCSRLLVYVGQQVRMGDVIAMSGSTGRSDGPHLHYEILVGGVEVDPLEYMEMPTGTAIY
jgi:murein DD-endopeptidase MepM/ murein hydrolase activator NlpD